MLDEEFDFNHANVKRLKPKELLKMLTESKIEDKNGNWIAVKGNPHLSTEMRKIIEGRLEHAKL